MCVCACVDVLRVAGVRERGVEGNAVKGSLGGWMCRMERKIRFAVLSQTQPYSALTD
jgi:hypothetical protein